MILHFLKRDLLDFKIGWLFIGFLTILCVLSAKFWENTWSLGILFYVYVLFGMLPIQAILGSVWRSQHRLSRHFLLSLPLPHKNLFLIQNVRLLIFALPAMVLGSLSPFLSLWEDSSVTVHLLNLYYFGLVISVGLFGQLMIWTTLEQEHIASNLLKVARLRAQIRLFVLFAGIPLVLGMAWAGLYYREILFKFIPPEELEVVLSQSTEMQRFLLLPLAECIFPLGFLCLIFWIFHNRRRWCVTL